MTDTRHLDTAIAILSGVNAPKRAPRKGVQMHVTFYQDTYCIQMNGKTIEEGVGDEAYAAQRAGTRAEAMRKLGKQVTVMFY